MKPLHALSLPACIRRFGFLAVVLLSAVSLRANPIEVPEQALTPKITFLIAFAILFEVVCVLILLRRSRKPRLFILWLIAMHVLTYPAFLGFLWMLDDIRPAFAVAIGEGVVVLVEGLLIYFICRCAPPAKPDQAAPSMVKCWLASLLGNVCSAVAFPVLLSIYDHF